MGFLVLSHDFTDGAKRRVEEIYRKTLTPVLLMEAQSRRPCTSKRLVSTENIQNASFIEIEDLFGRRGQIPEDAMGLHV